MAGLRGISGISVENIKLRDDPFVFPASHGINVAVMISEIATICALHACVKDFQLATFEEVVGTTDGNINIITPDMMKKMESNVFVGSIRLFNNAIHMAGFKGMSGIKVENIKL
eukprot:8109622-Karenia_brevis.AAC.1